MTCRRSIIPPTPVLVLDPVTLQFCAALARQSANGIRAERAHQKCAAEALRAFADEIESIKPERSA